MKHIAKQTKYLLALALLVLLAACRTATPVPLSISISADSETVAPGETITLTASIGGSGADASNVTWAATNGSFSALTGTTVTWTAPATQETVTIGAELASGGESVTDSLEINVTGDSGSPGGPGSGDLAITISADPSTVETNQTVTLEATIEGKGAAADNVRWSAEGDHGTFSADTGLAVTWTSPGVEGDYVISAELTYGDESVSADATIVVADTLGSLEIQISGLPDVAAAVTVLTGGDEIEFLTESATLTHLQPGDYTVAAADVVDGHLIHIATVSPATPITVEAGKTAGPATVQYSLSPTVLVTTVEDDASLPGSLRHLLALAAEPDSHIDTIGFSPSLFPDDALTILQLTDQLTVTEDLQITLTGPTGPDQDRLQLNLQADLNHRVFLVEDGAAVELRDLLLTGGNVTGAAEPYGGVIYNQGSLTMHNVDVTGGTAVHGGGIYSSGPLAISNGYVSANNSTGGGGGIYLASNSEASIAGSIIAENTAGSSTENWPQGGGIFLQNDISLELTDSTVRDNHAHGNGGGIGAWNDNEVTVRGSTFTGNSNVTGRGGGIWVNGPSQLSVINSTFTDNSAGTDGGAIGAGNNVTLWFSTVVGNTGGTDNGHRIGGVAVNAGGFSMVGSLVAGNSTAGTGTVIDLNLNSGTPSAPLEHNIVGSAEMTARTLLDASATNHRDAGLDPELEPLADNGGSTATMLPQAGALALDFVAAAACLDLVTVDQRGETRPNGSACDAGAVEVQ